MSKDISILLKAENRASGPIRAVSRDLGSLDRAAGRAGKGIRTAGHNLKLFGAGAAVAGVGLLTVAVKSGVESLVTLEAVNATTAAALKSTGQAAKFQAGEIRAWSESIESSVGAAVDDKAIQAGANNLLRFGTVSHDVFKRALADAVDLGAGMKTGPEAGAKLLGKALSDPVKGLTALRKAGIVLSAEETARIKQLIKGNRTQEAQVVLLQAVEKRYKGAAAASAGPYKTALNKIADASEDARMALAEGLLPVITKVADKLSVAVSDPKTMSAIRGFGQDLAKGFDQALAIADKIPWGTIGESLKLAGSGGKMLLDTFTGMPPWVQTAVLTGWGLNKLSGGALSGVVGELGKGLIKGVLGMNAGVVNIKAATVTGAGGGIVPTATKAGWASKLVQAVSIVSIAADALAVFGAWQGVNDASSKQAKDVLDTSNAWLSKQPTKQDLLNGLAGVEQGIADIRSNPLLMLVQGDALKHLETMDANIRAQIADLGKMADATGGYKGAEGKGAGYRPVDAMKTGISSLAGTVAPKLDLLHKDLAEGLSGIATGIRNNKPAGIAEEATRIANAVMKGVGSLTGTKGILAKLQAAREVVLSSGDKSALKQIDTAIQQVKSKVPGREWITEQKAAASKIARSNESTGQKVRELKGIQQSLIAHGDSAAARIVGALIGSVVPAINGISIPTASGAYQPGPNPLHNPTGPSPRQSHRTPQAGDGANVRTDPTKRVHAKGLLGMTHGKTDVGIAGEAGKEAVAIVKNPKPIGKDTGLPVRVMNWPKAGGGGSADSAGDVTGTAAWHVLRVNRDSPRHDALLHPVHVTVRAHSSAREAHKAHAHWRRYGGNGAAVSLD